MFHCVLHITLPHNGSIIWHEYRFSTAINHYYNTFYVNTEVATIDLGESLLTGMSEIALREKEVFPA